MPTVLIATIQAMSCGILELLSMAVTRGGHIKQCRDGLAIWTMGKGALARVVGGLDKPLAHHVQSELPAAEHRQFMRQPTHGSMHNLTRKCKVNYRAHFDSTYLA